MGFFALDNKNNTGLVGGLSTELIHRNECSVCPLNHAPGLCHPKMKPYGSEKPLVYILGEAPGGEEDRRGIPFVGPSGRIMHRHIPDSELPFLRWNNSIRCMPPRDQDGRQMAPQNIEIEACRPSIIRDIEAANPKAIFGFGNVALRWAIGETGITRWSGRRIPINVGERSYWFFPMVHPAAILREESKQKYRNKRSPFNTDLEFQFSLHMQDAFAALDDYLPEPKVYTREEMLEGIEVINGSGGEADLDRVAEVLEEIDRTDAFAGFDYETNKLRPWIKGAKLLSFAIAGSKLVIGVALDHKQARWSDCQLNKLFLMLSHWLKHRQVRLIAHHLPFELEWTAYTFGRDLLWRPEALWGDTECQAFILDERLGALSLEFLCIQEFGINIKAIDNLDRKNMEDAPVDDVCRYNGLDARSHRMLYKRQMKRLEQVGLLEVYRHQLHRAIAATAVQMKGVPIDQEINRRLLKYYLPYLQKLENIIADEPDVRVYEKLTGSKYRPSAAQDAKRFVAKVLHKQLDNADAKSLNTVNHPVIKKTLQWRQINKVVSTYVLSVTEGGIICVGDQEWEVPRSPHLTDEDGWIRPILSVNKTRTNRTSSEDPNCQNWPVRTKQGIEARSQVSLGDDYVVVALDYSGIQARNVAMESGDKTLVKYFWNRYDIHSDWLVRIQKACERRNVKWIPGGVQATEGKSDEAKELKKKFRYLAKNKLVFPSFFGAQPRSIAVGLGVPEPVAYDLHEEFWDEFPGVRKWQERTIADYYKQGYVTGVSGFRRHAPVAYNELINSPIQGDEARIVCDAMIRLTAKEDPAYTPNLEVHDDLSFIWPRRKVDEYAEVVIGEMLKVRFNWINVPLGVEMSIGPNWAEKKTGPHNWLSERVRVGEFYSDTWFNFTNAPA